jgi:hypothetical protein
MEIPLGSLDFLFGWRTISLGPVAAPAIGDPRKAAEAEVV